MLAYFVMPAVASLAAARDDARAWSGSSTTAPRLHRRPLAAGGAAGLDLRRAVPALWVGAELRRRQAALMRLFLVATVPLVLSVPVQMAIGMNKIG